MKPMKILWGILMLALASIVAPSAAVANDTNPAAFVMAAAAAPAAVAAIPDDADTLNLPTAKEMQIPGGGTAFTSYLGYIEVAPNLFLSGRQISDIREYGCTGGPDALFMGRQAKIEWCSLDENKMLGKVLKSGANLWRVMATPVGLNIEMYLKGKGRDPNVRCWGMAGYRGFTQVAMTCVNTANGTMFWHGVLGALIGNGGSQAIGALVSNLTAPKAGDENIIIGQQGTSSSTSSSTGGNGAAPITINNNPLFDVRAGAAATVTLPSCGTSVC